ncbi:MAG: hypothetical protein GY820_28555, partial [Gammaproteobacteria bacterium]|nr:hypothetical protein [Gammaproteobacteria bacterium]
AQRSLHVGQRWRVARDARSVVCTWATLARCARRAQRSLHVGQRWRVARDARCVVCSDT